MDFPTDFPMDFPMVFAMDFPMDFPMDFAMNFPMDFPMVFPMDRSFPGHFSRSFFRVIIGEKYRCRMRINYPNLAIYMPTGPVADKRQLVRLAFVLRGKTVISS